MDFTFSPLGITRFCNNSAIYNNDAFFIPFLIFISVVYILHIDAYVTALLLLTLLVCFFRVITLTTKKKKHFLPFKFKEKNFLHSFHYFLFLLMESSLNITIDSHLNGSQIVSTNLGSSTFSCNFQSITHKLDRINYSF